MKKNLLNSLFVSGTVCLFSILPGLVKGQQRPNILLIFSDDHAYQATSIYGNKIIQTPNIDRIAREGAILLNNFVTNSICGPSRDTLLTGKYSHINGYKLNEKKFDFNQQVFPALLQQSVIKQHGSANFTWAIFPLTDLIISTFYPGRGSITIPILSTIKMIRFAITAISPT